MARTMHQDFVTALKMRGYAHVKSTGKYEVYQKPGECSFLYVGLRGALRLGTTRATSIPVSEPMKLRLLAEARGAD